MKQAGQLKRGGAAFFSTASRQERCGATSFKTAGLRLCQDKAQALQELVLKKMLNALRTFFLLLRRCAFCACCHEIHTRRHVRDLRHEAFVEVNTNRKSPFSSYLQRKTFLHDSHECMRVSFLHFFLLSCFLSVFLSFFLDSFLPSFLLPSFFLLLCLCFPFIFFLFVIVSGLFVFHAFTLSRLFGCLHACAHAGLLAGFRLGKLGLV